MFESILNADAARAHASLHAAMRARLLLCLVFSLSLALVSSTPGFTLTEEGEAFRIAYRDRSVFVSRRGDSVFVQLQTAIGVPLFTGGQISSPVWTATPNSLDSTEMQKAAGFYVASAVDLLRST